MPDISKRCCKLGYLIFTLTIFFLAQNEQLFSQTENYSSYSQGVLDTYNSAEENDGVLEIFTFSAIVFCISVVFKLILFVSIVSNAFIMTQYLYIKL